MQDLQAYLPVHHAIRQFTHVAAPAEPLHDADRISYLGGMRIIR